MNHDDDRPPVGGSWARLYTAVALYLVAVIAFFTLFTRMFNR